MRHPVPMSIEVRGLSKVFTTGRRRERRQIEAVRDLSLTVGAGERLAYIGPNGAGKSTSIKILTGILHPTNGEATVLGASGSALRAANGNLQAVQAGAFLSARRVRGILSSQ